MKVLSNQLGQSPKLSGIVSAYHPSTPGSNPMHNIYAFSIYIVQLISLSVELECEMNKNK